MLSDIANWVDLGLHWQHVGLAKDCNLYIVVVSLEAAVCLLVQLCSDVLLQQILHCNASTHGTGGSCSADVF